MVEAVSSADLGVIPIQSTVLSYYYALPNKLFECLMAGVPVATSNFPEMEAIVSKHAVGATFDPANAQDIARAVNQVLNSADLASMRQRAKEIAQSRYCWEVESQQLLAVYKAHSDNQRVRLSMLVRNPFIHDTRVLREAKTLSHQGFDVTIIAVNPRRDLPEREERDGFTIFRVEVNPLSVRVVRGLAVILFIPKAMLRVMRAGAAPVVRFIARLRVLLRAKGLPAEEQRPPLTLGRRLGEAAIVVIYGLAMPFVLVARLLRTIWRTIVATLDLGGRLGFRLLAAGERQLIGLARKAVMLFHDPLSSVRLWGSLQQDHGRTAG